jgi:hypothetical protein
MKYVAVIDPPIVPPSKTFLEDMEKHKKHPKKHPKPTMPKPRKRILVGRYDTVFEAANARNVALTKLGFWRSFYYTQAQMEKLKEKLT